MTKPKVGVKCVKCGYGWKTSTKLGYISCPNCRHTNKTDEAMRAAAKLEKKQVKKEEDPAPVATEPKKSELDWAKLHLEAGE